MEGMRADQVIEPIEAAAARAVHVAERLLTEWDDLDPEQRVRLAATAPSPPATEPRSAGAVPTVRDHQAGLA